MPLLWVAINSTVHLKLDKWRIEMFTRVIGHLKKFSLLDCKIFASTHNWSQGHGSQVYFLGQVFARPTWLVLYNRACTPSSWAILRRSKIILWLIIIMSDDMAWKLTRCFLHVDFNKLLVNCQTFISGYDFFTAKVCNCVVNYGLFIRSSCDFIRKSMISAGKPSAEGCSPLPTLQ